MGLGIAPKNRIFGYVPEIYELILNTADFSIIYYKFCCKDIDLLLMLFHRKTPLVIGWVESDKIPDSLWL
jgi:uncharacterized circularly permuted ATP-grasp superfamily protein